MGLLHTFQELKRTVSRSLHVGVHTLSASFHAFSAANLWSSCVGTKHVQRWSNQMAWITSSIFFTSRGSTKFKTKNHKDRQNHYQNHNKNSMYLSIVLITLIAKRLITKKKNINNHDHNHPSYSNHNDSHIHNDKVTVVRAIIQKVINDYWLVVDLPIWKIWKSIRMMTFPRLMGK